MLTFIEVGEEAMSTRWPRIKQWAALGRLFGLVSLLCQFKATGLYCHLPNGDI